MTLIPIRYNDGIDDLPTLNTVPCEKGLCARRAPPIFIPGQDHEAMAAGTSSRSKGHQLFLRRGLDARWCLHQHASPSWLDGGGQPFFLRTWINDDQRATHDGMQLTMVGVLSRRKWCDGETAVGRHRDRIEGTGTLGETAIMPDAVRDAVGLTQRIKIPTWATAIGGR